jgi:RimJ/RimL family protein N-acetyltransferase
MVTRSYGFETHRLRVDAWHAAAPADGSGPALPDVVVSLLSPAVTRALPVEWQGSYSRSRAEAWIAERDADGPTLLALERSSRNATGLVILHESDAADGSGVDVHLGYVLAESAWGQGLGSELVEGLVSWCRGQPEIHTLIAGVAAENPASVRILEKNGFKPVEARVDEAGGERMFGLRLR